MRSARIQDEGIPSATVRTGFWPVHRGGSSWTCQRGLVRRKSSWLLCIACRSTIDGPGAPNETVS